MKFLKVINKVSTIYYILTVLVFDAIRLSKLAYVVVHNHRD